MSDRLTSTPLVPPTANNPTTTQPIQSGPVLPGTILSPVRRDAFDRVTAYLRRLGKEKFFGNVEITLRDGEIQVVRTEQTLKLTEIPTTATPADTAVALGTTTAVTEGA